MAKDFQDLPEIMERVGEDLEASLRAGVLDAALELEGEIKETIFGEFQGRTGMLARSYKTTFVEKPKGADFGAKVTSTLVYAGIQDTGGDIYPRQSQYLTVPIGEGKELPTGTYARDLGLDFRMYPSGTMLLGRASKSGFNPYFVLKRHVKLRGRQYLEKAEKKAMPQIEELLGDNMETTILRDL